MSNLGLTANTVQINNLVQVQESMPDQATVSNPVNEAVHKDLETSKDSLIQSKQDMTATQNTIQEDALSDGEKSILAERNATTLFIGAYKSLNTSVKNITQEPSPNNLTALKGSLEHLKSCMDALPEKYQLALKDIILTTINNAKANMVLGQDIKPVDENSKPENIQNTQSNNDTDIADAKKIEAYQCDPKIIDILKEMLADKEGYAFHMLRNEHDTVESLEARYNAISELIEKLPEDTNVSSLLFKVTSANLTILNASAISLANCNMIQADISDNAKLPIKEQWEGLNNNLVLERLENAQTNIKAQEGLNSKDGFERLIASNALQTSGTWRAYDVEKLSASTYEYVGDLFNKSLKSMQYNTGLSKENQIVLGKILADARIDPLNLAKNIVDAMQSYYPIPVDNMTVAQQKEALHNVRQEFITMALGALCDTSTSDIERLQYVDSLFQHDYARFSNTALQLKEAILPENLLHADIALAHEAIVAISDIKNILVDGTGSTKSFAINMNRASARSFLLTPQLVGNILNKQGNTQNLNYHLSHVAILQYKAIQTGLLGQVPAEMKHFSSWYKSLGLGQEATVRGLDIAKGLDGFSRRQVLEKMADLYSRGISGSLDAKKADVAVKTVGKIGTKGTEKQAAKSLNKLYSQNINYSAGVVLDNYIANLSGLILAEDRLCDSKTGLAYNQDRVNDAIRENINNLNAKFSKLPVHALMSGEDLQQAVQDRADANSFIKNRQLNNISSTKFLVKMANLSNEHTILQANVRAKEAQKESYDKNIKSVSFAWPHQRAARRAMCEDIFRLAELDRAIKTGESANGLAYTEEELSSFELEKDTVLGKLKGVDPYSLKNSKGAIYNRKPTMETVLNEMLPRAKAWLSHVDGKHKQEVKDLIKAHIKLKKADIKLNLYVSKIDRAVGSEVMNTLRTAYKAAVLDTFINSGQDESTFSMNNFENIEEVNAKLRDFGIDAQRGLVSIILPQLSSQLCDSAGRIKPSFLNKENEKFTLDLAAKDSYKEYKKDLRSDLNVNRLKARSIANKAVFKSEALQEAISVAGTKGFMVRASKSGDSFIIDRKRGLVFDTGKKFHTLRNAQVDVSGSRIKDSQGTNIPITFNASYINDKNIAVVNAGGKFEVTIKDADIFSGGFGGTLALPGGHAKIAASVGVTGDRVTGLNLRFNDAESTEAFLQHLLDHDQSKTSKINIWEKADAVSFITEKGKAINGGVSLSVTLLNEALLGDMNITASAVAGVDGKIANRHSTKENAFGVTHSVEREVSVAGKLAFSARIMDTEKKTLRSINQLSKAVVKGFISKQRIDIIQDGNKISGKMTFSAPKGMSSEAKSLGLMISEYMLTHGKEGTDFAADFDKIMHELPPNANVSCHFKLSPNSQKRIDQLNAMARQGDEKLLKNIEKEVNSILCEVKHYMPDKFTFTLPNKPTNAGEMQFGLRHIQVVRETTFNNIKSLTLNMQDYMKR